jgi:hypothetical protein
MAESASGLDCSFEYCFLSLPRGNLAKWIFRLSLQCTWYWFPWLFHNWLCRPGTMWPAEALELRLFGAKDGHEQLASAAGSDLEALQSVLRLIFGEC